MSQTSVRKIVSSGLVFLSFEVLGASPKSAQETAMEAIAELLALPDNANSSVLSHTVNFANKSTPEGPQIAALITLILKRSSLILP